MPIATLTSKGQITLPLAVRAALGLTTGSRVDFVSQDAGPHASFKVVPVRNEVARLKGRFAGRVSKPVSVEAMNRAIAGAAARRNTPGGK